MSQKLPDGWATIKGVSCAGWDIWAAWNGGMPAGRGNAIFRRRIADQEHLEMARIYPNETELFAALDEIRTKLMNGIYGFDELFPEEQLARHPNYGAF